MKKLKVLTWPDPHLKEKAWEVPKVDDNLKEFCENLHYTMLEEDGIGLAATQVGVNVRAIAFGLKELPRIMINPVILSIDHKKKKEIEGCLSLPGFFAEVERCSTVIVKYLDENGEEHEGTFEGLAAVAIQHEIDHLDGIVFVDYLGPVKREQAKKAIKKYLRLKKKLTNKNAPK